MDEDIFDFDSQYQELLFESNDDQTETTIARENENDFAKLDLFSIFFDCQGDSIANFNKSVFKEDLEIIFNHLNYEIPDEIKLFGYDFDDTFENYDGLIQMARASIQKIHLSSLDSFSKTFYNLRENVTKLLLMLRCNYQHLNDNQLKTIRLMLGTFDSMTNFSLMHISFSNEGNSSNSSNYHLLHGSLEWRWIFLTILYKIDYFKGYIGTDDADSVAEIKLLIYDLITLSLSKFQKCNSANLMFTSPFICSCVKQMWLLIYYFIEKLQDDLINFWNIIATVIDELSNGRSLYEKIPLKKVLMRSSTFVTCRNFDQFSLWMVSGIVKLIGSEQSKLLIDKQSYELYESLIKTFLKTDQTEENMRVLMLMISEVLVNIWQPRAEILMLLWESFQKKINSPFLIAGQTPNYMAVIGSSTASFLEQIRTQQNTPASKLNLNFTSYSLFVHTLGKMVQKFTDDGQKVQIQKILGRIYTKFPATKLKQLNEMGIHNMLKLFITLAISTNLSDIASKIIDTLLQFPLEKPNHQQLIMKGHISMLVLYCENALNISQYLTKLMTQINILMQQSSSANVLKILSESLSLIVLRNMNENADIFENGEDLLIDAWIIKFLQGSTTAEKDRLFETLTKIIQKIQSIQSSSLLVSNQTSLVTQKLFNFILPYAKQNFGNIESIWMPEMLANLCLLLLEPNIMVNDVPKFESLFRTFVEINSNNNHEQCIKFITVIIKRCQDAQKLDMLLVMQNWIRFSVLLGGNNNELKELTKCVIYLDEFTSLCSKTEEILNSKEPLCIFISEIGKKYAESNNQQKFLLLEKIHAYFSTFEKWSLPILQQLQQKNTPASTQTSSSVDEYIMRIYTFIAITFLHCSELIFIRTKSSCFFNVTISHFILPSALMVGQTLARSIIVSIHKVWPLLIEGTSRLNFKNDQHINKVLSDIITKWAPLLKLSSNSKFVAKPFISVSNFKNLDLIEFFWTKLSKNYLALQPGRKIHPSCCMILTVIEEVFHVIESDEKRLMAIWRSIMQQIFEMAMLLEDIEPTKKTCMNLIERYIRNKNFETSVSMKELLMKNLKHLTSSSLSYHSALYFKFLTKLLKQRATIVTSLLPHLLTQIEKVEQLRGSGRDVKLRNLYDQLQSQCR